MRRMWFCISLIGIVLLLGLSAIVLSNEWLWRWQVRAQPPVPAEAISVQVYHPSDDTRRIIQFDIDPGAVNRVQQFYRTELPKYGWRYRCTVDKPLGVGIELVDVYERTTQNLGGEMLDVAIGKKIALDLQGRGKTGGKRVIWLNEWLPSLPPPPYKGCTAR